MLNMSEETMTLLSSAAVAGGTTVADGAVIDMAQAGGFDAVEHIVVLGDVADTAVIVVSLEESANSNGSSSSAVSGASATFTAGASTADSKIITLDVAKRTLRYVFVRVTRTVANAPIAAIVAKLYKAKQIPVTQTSVVIAEDLLAG